MPSGRMFEEEGGHGPSQSGAREADLPILGHHSCDVGEEQRSDLAASICSVLHGQAARRLLADCLVVEAQFLQVEDTFVPRRVLSIPSEIAGEVLFDIASHFIESNLPPSSLKNTVSLLLDGTPMCDAGWRALHSGISLCMARGMSVEEYLSHFTPLRLMTNPDGWRRYGEIMALAEDRGGLFSRYELAPDLLERPLSVSALSAIEACHRVLAGAGLQMGQLSRHLGQISADPASPEMWGVVEDFVSLQPARPDQLFHALGVIGKARLSVLTIRKPGAWAFVSHGLQKLLREELPLELFHPNLIDGVVEGRPHPDPEGIRLLDGALSSLGLLWERVHSAQSGVAPSALCEAFIPSGEPGASALLNDPRLRKFLSNREQLPLAGLKKFIQQYQLYRLACQILLATDTGASEFYPPFTRLGKTDTLPLSIGAKGGPAPAPARRMFNQTLSVMRRAIDVHLGFQSLAFEARRPPKIDPLDLEENLPLLPRFGRDVCESVSAIAASSVDRFPGPGWELADMDIGRIFAKDPTATGAGEDPYRHLIGEGGALELFKDEFLDLGSTTFLFLRGVIVVTPPRDAKYSLHGAHYSYVIWNDHFYEDPRSFDAAALVPSRLIENAVASARIPIDELGDRRDAAAIVESALTLRELRRAARESATPLINLGWGSNITGGLCNAYPPGEDPLHGWEKPFNDNHPGHQDAWGHVHKSYILGDGVYYAVMTPEMERLLRPYVRAHDMVYRVSTSMQNLLDLFRVSISLWHRGMTGGRDDSDGTSRPELSEEENPSNPESLRMLKEAYKWHFGGHRRGFARDSFPLLVFMPVLNAHSVPDSDVILDTYDMSVRFKDADGMVDRVSFPHAPSGLDGGGGTGYGDRFEDHMLFGRFFTVAFRGWRDVRFVDRGELPWFDGEEH